METEIILTPRFKKQFDKIIEYLLSHWSSREAFQFIDKVYSQLALIKKQPEIGKPSSKVKNVRSVQVKPYNHIYYRITSSAIQVLSLVDSRKHPRSNRYK
jgi:plasmid stabilization system protein ParE